MDSIFDEMSRGRPAGLRLFTNRFEPSRNFAARINDDPPRQTISFYAGVGGNGKTALLRNFQARCCFRMPPESWQEVRPYPDEFFVDSLAQAPGTMPVPVAFLDFGAQPSGANRPQEAFSALFMLKRQLGTFGIDTPRFDFAAIAYLHKSGADVRSVVSELFPEPELASAASLADAFLQIPVFQVGVALYEVVRGRLDNLLSRRRIKRGVPNEVIEEVVSLAPEPDLVHALPRFFAADLRAALVAGPHERIVLLFDTFEAFAGESGPAGKTRIADLGGPHWFRSLLGNLPLGGVVVVVAGRTPPRWSEAPTDAIPERYVETTALGPLPQEYADAYLIDAGVEDPAMRSAIIAYAAVEPGLVHPLLLGLSADVALAGAETGRSFDPAEFSGASELHAKERALTARLLSQVGSELEDAIIAVAAARSFDRSLFVHLGTHLDFPVTAADYRRVIAFSFVTPYQQAVPRGDVGPGRPSARFTVHKLLRRALERIAPDLSSRAHQALVAYYSTMDQDDQYTARLERIHHQGRLDPADGVARWRDEMEAALSISRFDRCRSLIALLADMEVPSQTDAEACAYLVARAEIALGRWEVAERLLDQLPAAAPYANLLRADLAFARNDFGQAELYSAEALAGAGQGAERLPFLIRAAEIRLFHGKFGAGKRLCEEGLAIIGTRGDANDAARCHDLYAELEFFSGNVDAAKARLRLAQASLDSIPEASWDRVVQADIRIDHAVVAESENRPLDARRERTEALRIRTEITDVRGAAAALNGLGLAAVQLGDAAEAEARFSEAATAARDLGEKLLYAKARRGHAEAAMLAGRFDDADELVEEALRGFEDCGVPYDVTHAWITQARIHRARGDDAAWLALVDRARREIERAGFRGLYARCPEVRLVTADRIAAVMVAFAAGDALGVPWEGNKPREIDLDRVADLPPREDWPRGATSDDTAQMMLVAESLVDTEGRPTTEDFLARLAAAQPTMRGIGPSTRAALEHYRETGRPPQPAENAGQQATNGAAMRIPPVGCMVPAADPDLRRELVITLARATHTAPASVGAAYAMAAMAAWAVEGVGLDAIVAAGIAEIDWFSDRNPEAADAFDPLREAAAGRWQPPPDGVRYFAAPTVAAVMHVLRAHDDLVSALPYAVSLGGDTDTVAALVGGLLGAHDPAGLTRLTWLDRVAFEERDRVDGIARRLQALRNAWYSR